VSGVITLTWPAQFSLINRLAALAGQASARLDVKVTLAGAAVCLTARAKSPGDPLAEAELDQLLSSLPQWSTSR
jgi:type IV secretory pathway protease TraF